MIKIPALAKLMPALGIALAGMLVLLGVQSCRLGDARENHGQARQALAQCEADLASQRSESIAARDELTDLVSQMAVDSQAVAEALLASERRDRQRERADQAEARARAEIYQQVPDCETWAQIPVCREIAERQQARRAELIRRWEGEPDE